MRRGAVGWRSCAVRQPPLHGGAARARCGRDSPAENRAKKNRKKIEKKSKKNLKSVDTKYKP